MTANGVVSWIEYVASLVALYVCPTAIAVVRRARNIKRVLILNCIPIAWPAALVACMMARKADWRASLPASPLWTLTPSPQYGDGVSAAWDARLTGQLAQDRCVWACHQARRAEPAHGSRRPHIIASIMTMPRHLATPGHRPRPAVLNPPGLRATGSLVSGRPGQCCVYGADLRHDRVTYYRSRPGQREAGFKPSPSAL